MPQPNRKYKRLEALLSEANPADPNPASQSVNGEVDSLKSRIAELESKLENQPGVDETKSSMPLAQKTTGLKPLMQMREGQSDAVGKQQPLSVGKGDQARSAFLITTAIAIAHFVAVAYYLYLGRTTSAAQFNALAVISFVLGVLIGTGAVLSRRGKPTLGLILALGSMAVSYPPVSATLVGGLGLVLGVALMVAGPMTAFQILPRRSAWVMTVITIVAGLATVLLDVFGSAARPSLPGIFIQIVAVSVILVLAYFIASQLWTSARIRNRIIVTLSALLIPMIAASAWYNIQSQRQNLEKELTNKAETVAISGAATIGHLLEEAIANGDLTSRQVFDTNYKLYWKFDPSTFEFDGDPATLNKYHTAYDAYTDEHWQKLLDSFLNQTDFVFTIPVDKNGYLPTHNTRWSSFDGSPATDRSKRLFRDPVGIKAALNTQPTLMQVYKRPGTGETLLDVSAPIYVNGEHWGAFRVGIVLAENSLFAQSSIQSATRRNLFVSIFLVIGIVAGSWLVGRYISRPLEKLTEGASKFASGQFDELVDIPDRAEVTVLANAFNEMSSQLKDLIDSLEERVAERTHDLELAAEVVRTVTEKVSNVDDMLSKATEMIRSRFDLYYTQVYLLDPTGKTLILRAGSGDVGQQLLRRGHHLSVNSGSLNGRAVSGKKPIIVADTAQNPDFLPNPLLPNTRSEMAVPLIVSGHALGVLDMQSEIPGALSQSNLPALEALAGQISIAIQNAALFAQSEEARQKVEANVRQIATAGWMDFLNGTDRGEKIGYIFDQTDVKPLERNNIAKSGIGLSVPISVTGADVGSIQIAQDEREWTSTETDIVRTTANQLAQHIENLRLLAQAEKYRLEAEQTNRRLTREGWEGFLQTRKALAAGYSYNPNDVKAEYEAVEFELPSTHSLPITVRDEAIGELMINADHVDSNAMDEIFSAVAAQLGGHIENLRLLETTEYELAERVRTEQELLKVRLGMDRANDAVFITETDGTIIYVNPAFERIYGWKAEEAIGKTPRIFKSGLIPAEQYKTFWGALTSNQVVAGEIINKTKDGRLIPIEGNNNPIVNADGKIIGFLGMHRDITERKNAQEIIARRASELETVATVSTAAATLLDPDKLLQAVVDLTKERFNVYHSHIYLVDESGNTLKLASGAGEVGRQMVETGHAIQVGTERSLVARASRERKPIIVNDVRVEAGFLRNPMLPGTLSEMAVPMISGDKVIGVFDVQADTVNRFTDEDANIYTTLASQVAVSLQNARLYVEQAATVTQLRELDRLKSSFLANMSHELRTPLNSILGFSDVILEGLDGPLTDHMNNDLQLIQKNGQHLLHLINDVLDMAKIESGRMNLHTEKFKIHEILDEVTSITSTLASDKKLSLFIEPSSDREVEVSADRTRLRQVMINLVNNSIKFTEEGKVAINVRRYDDEHILVTVSDTGQGIPADQLEAIFLEFTQVDSTTTRKTGGTGLGLPISRRLVEMHGGKLWVESSGIDGEGSTFFVKLPLEARIAEGDRQESFQK